MALCVEQTLSVPRGRCRLSAQKKRLDTEN